jgi:F-type Type IV secretion system, TraN
MQFRHSQPALIGLLSLFLPLASVYAANWSCGQDLNLNGDLGQPGETASCFGSPSGGALCPISAINCSSNQKMVCKNPVALSFDVKVARQFGSFTVGFDLKTGAVTSGPTGLVAQIPTLDFDSICTNNNPINATGSTTWDAPSLSGTNFVGTTRVNLVTAPSCANGLVGTIQITDDYTGGLPSQAGGQVSFSTTSETCALETQHACPLGNSYSCMENAAGQQQCSPNACVDLATQAPVVEDIDTGMYQDDGATAADGACLGQMMIFAGRAMRCDKAGVSTAFQNCCKNTGKVLTDDTGDSGSPTQMITSVYDSITQGKSEYEAALAAGAPAMAAANAAATVAGDVMANYGVAVDPTAMVGAVIDYFTQSCDQTSTETGVLNGSGFCYEIGEYCREEWEFVGCVQKAKSYCCFNSKMGRIIHQQGRAQLSSVAGFGTPEAPNCRGLTPEEFQSIDFSKIDFSEYYGDLVPDTMTQIEGKISNGVTDFYNSNQ